MSERLVLCCEDSGVCESWASGAETYQASSSLLRDFSDDIGLHEAISLANRKAAWNGFGDSHQLVALQLPSRS